MMEHLKVWKVPLNEKVFAPLPPRRCRARLSDVRPPLSIDDARGLCFAT